MSEERLKYKKQIHELCLAQIEASLHTIEQRLQSVQESKNNETKSSVGDKYETGRAMMQMEEENINRQKAKVLNNKIALKSIDANMLSDSIKMGTVVITNQLNFYISIALGKIKVDGKLFYCISREAPIGKMLYGKKKDDLIDFNGKKYKILEVY